MRPRSGGFHCQTEEQLIELASNNQVGRYYDKGPKFHEVKFQEQWSFDQALNKQSKPFSDFDCNIQQLSEADQEQKQLSRGKRYLGCCIVDLELIRCSIDICIITPKINQTIGRIVDKDSILNLFIHNNDASSKGNCIYKHSTVSSKKNSNVFTVQTHDVELCTGQKQKENQRVSPKNWLKNNKNQKMFQLIIVKKHIFISQNSEIGKKKITIIHRIYVINEKYIQNSLIKVYLEKCQYLVSMINNSSKQKVENQIKGKIYDKLFTHRSILEKDCIIYQKGQYLRKSQELLEETHKIVKFKNIFHKLEQKIAKNYMKKLNQILIEQKKKS